MGICIPRSRGVLKLDCYAVLLVELWLAGQEGGNCLCTALGAFLGEPGDRQTAKLLPRVVWLGKYPE
ncbi:hypothetical protein Q9966_004113 [Columba livia]|nr:hypothetical protein Q9966_004113 [Columba livia]